MTDCTSLALTVKCRTCKAPPGQRCATKLARGYHITRADKAVARQQRREQKGNPA